MKNIKHHSGHYEREELQVHSATAPAAHRARFSRMHFKGGIDVPWLVVVSVGSWFEPEDNKSCGWTASLFTSDLRDCGHALLPMAGPFV